MRSVSAEKLAIHQCSSACRSGGNRKHWAGCACGIGTAAGHPLPVAGILGKVGIDQVTVEQLHACAEAGVFLISPFVGRILDWYVANGQTPANIDEDPGVVFVRGVYAEFKRRGSPTVVMGASFRSTAQIEALAGCDRLTISPDLLEKLDADHGALPRKLVAGAAEAVQVTPIDAATFAADLAADPMATEKLATGIDAFAKDLQALRERIRSEL